ncbi:restriction endonuclease subunit S [Sediminibacterium ginsengisoli]|uniref:Type I restriction enzyme, S subunit n=1 Tax=Sediminibacterium ginsengisoli TaxID=413434 RepID=A0A1T4RJV3_9BACT|nr:restriction endonuclease subunit S [Sediminibacterium ginsengisoli]SKA16300.1 type I restriction enzyme, S subunit [Sediminibacterium ginsengisoli]
MRFPGFEGEWEIVKLKDCSVSLDYGMNAAATLYDGENKYIRITDINERSSEYISNPPVSPEGDLTDHYLVQENDILLARTGASTGKSYLYNVEDGKLYFAGFLIRARIKEVYNARFIFAQTQIETYKRWVKLMSMRSGQPGINSQEYGSYEIAIPSRKEQDRIASFLELIDRRIATQNKIIEKLETLIKGIREGLLNKQLRFLGASDDWKKYKVSDFLEFFPTNSLSWEQLDYYNGGTLYNLHYGLIHQGAPTLIDTDSYTLPKIKLSSNPSNFTLCENGDIVFADASEDTIDVAKAVEIINCGDKKIVCGLHTIHGRDKLNLTVKGFKGYLFRSRIFRHQVRQLAQGTKVFSVSIRTFNECYVDIPSMKEQLKISAALTKIDQRIDCEKKLLTRYRQQKGYLLGSLFI